MILLEMILKNAEYGYLEIEVSYSKDGIEDITVNGERPQGREIEMINMSLPKIKDAVNERLYQDAKETEYEDRLFLGRAF